MSEASRGSSPCNSSEKPPIVPSWWQILASEEWAPLAPSEPLEALGEALGAWLEGTVRRSLNHLAQEMPRCLEFGFGHG